MLSADSCQTTFLILYELGQWARLSLAQWVQGLVLSQVGLQRPHPCPEGFCLLALCTVGGPSPFSVPTFGAAGLAGD